jgi:hypothetical protein
MIISFKDKPVVNILDDELIYVMNEQKELGIFSNPNSSSLLEIKDSVYKEFALE